MSKPGYYQGRPSRRFACTFRYDGTPDCQHLEGPIVGCCAVSVQVGPAEGADLSRMGERAVGFLTRIGVIGGRDQVIQIHVRLDRTIARDEMRVEARTSSPPSARIGVATRKKVAEANRRRSSQFTAA